jgi:putative Holliday junction resolvase
MKIIGIDWGEAKIGLAWTDGVLAEPLAVIRPDQLKVFVDQYQPDLILVGISENKSGQKARVFGKKLQEEVGIKVKFVDESLTTKEAQILSREAGIGRKRRRDMEDAYAAAILLQNYLDMVLDRVSP